MAINALAISPNGTLIATGSDDATTRIWQFASLETTPAASVVRGPSGGYATLAMRLADERISAVWSDNGQSGERSRDGRILVISTSDGVQVLDMSAPPQAILKRTINSGATLRRLSPDGNTLVTVSSSSFVTHTVRVWDLRLPDFNSPPVRTFDIQGTVSLNNAISLSYDGKILGLTVDV
jgi:WD40 repeat protein